jgi:1-acyl-sn-glycerol-3-phosphate acyltransferase
MSGAVELASNTYEVPWNNRFARSVLRPVFRWLFRILGKVEIIGLENIPREGAYLVAPNHISIFDGPFVAVFWPDVLEVAGASVVWKKPGQSTLARLWGGIKVHRGQYDRALIDTTLAALQSGHPLLIAPEGGRSHVPGLRRANPGVAYLMDKARVPVVPVGVVGGTEDFVKNALRGKRQRIAMYIGKPLSLEPVEEKGAARREKRQKNADLVMAHIAALLPVDYRGIYVDHEILTGQAS